MMDKNFLRLVLLIYITLYLPGAGFSPTIGWLDTLRQNVSAEMENGMGGGMSPAYMQRGTFNDAQRQETPSQAEMDFDIAGILDIAGAINGEDFYSAEDFYRPQMLTFNSYTLERGDMIGNIAVRTGLNEDTLISVNSIRNTRLIQIGQAIRIPNQDGIYYTVKEGDTLDNIAERYGITAYHIQTVNELFSDTVTYNTSLFIPGGRMNWVERQEINGDLFAWPTTGRITSGYGFRRCPFTGVRQFHTGMDIGASTGTAVRAAMSGRVASVGYDTTLGNTVVISHHSGYRTLYAHLSVARVKPGAYVQTGERIGDVGSTGLSTGPHLHFSVYKNGVTVNPRSLMR